MDYLVLKWVHIVSSTILFGTGIGTAFFMFMAHRSRDVASVHFATRHVVMADFLFTAPAVIVQFLTGVALMHKTGFSLTDRWLAAGIALYFFAGLCWLPVVWMQIRMRNLAKAAMETGGLLPDAYWGLSRYWAALGCLAFPAVAAVFYLMVVKPEI